MKNIHKDSCNRQDLKPVALRLQAVLSVKMNKAHNLNAALSDSNFNVYTRLSFVK